ncbi:MAG TPA: orotidine-5'-phosphate decarboxylase [Candidatus Micrarchaeia archaeon]|nr:orotidine-5'-phosphate decarboxylase [Candidatus Micrarchaeia archaeon]
MRGPAAPFAARLADAVARVGAPLCIGLDPVVDDLPSPLSRDPAGARELCLRVIEATHPYAAAYKPNSGFFEALGPAGAAVLAEVVAAARAHAPVILDGKRGDIGHTSSAYATAAYQQLGADACTVSPYLGQDAVAPFLAVPGRLAFLLCRTSNPGAADLQDLVVRAPGEAGARGEPLYLRVARLAVEWDRTGPGGTTGLVAAATWPAELASVRRAAPGLPILVPGVGAQAGDLEAASRAAAGADGSAPFLVAVSRGVTGASRGPDFAAAAGLAARGWCDRLRLATAGG